LTCAKKSKFADKIVFTPGVRFGVQTIETTFILRHVKVKLF